MTNTLEKKRIFTLGKFQVKFHIKADLQVGSSRELLDRSNNDRFSRNGKLKKLQPHSAPSHDCQTTVFNVTVAVGFQEYCTSGDRVEDG